ncbi:MAG: nitrite reductase small subunit NirD [Mariprofundaceae bacterium]|nr:nitrite reductase small subunit NirD [Mariprofundaceae bacterium]
MSNHMNSETSGKWHPVCQVEEIPPLGGRTVRTCQMEIAVFRLSDGRIRAVHNSCPHKQGPLADGIVSGDTIICPMHAWKISLESGEVLPPDSGCVKTYSAKVEDGQVLLRL